MSTPLTHDSAKVKFNGISNILMMFRDEEEPQTVYTVGGMLDQYGVFELCKPALMQPPLFALRLKGKPLAYLKEIEDTNHCCKFKPVAKVPWSLPTEMITYENEESLYNEIRALIVDHVDMPKEGDYDVLTCWVLATWLAEKWVSFPFLNFFGALECGKSRCSEVLGRLSFRGWNATFVSAASLYRVVDTWHPTLLLDETEPLMKNPEIVSLLNASYRKGATVPRQTAQEDGSFRTEFFELHGFRVLSGTRELPQTLKSRSIVFHMQRCTRRVRMFLNEDRCLALRNKLLDYRFKKILDDEGYEGDNCRCGLANLEEIGEQLGSGRLAEIFYCLVAVAPTQEIKNKIIEYAKDLDKERSEELASSDDSVCLTAILKVKNQGKMVSALILIGDVAAEVNKNLNYNEHWTNRKVGSICSRLGFKKQTNRQKLTCIKWDEKLIDALKKDQRYSVCFEAEEIVPLTLQTSPSSPSSPISENWLNGIKEVIKT